MMKKIGIYGWIIIISLFVLDLVTKYWAYLNQPSFLIMKYFGIIYTENPGFSFGLRLIATEGWTHAINMVVHTSMVLFVLFMLKYYLHIGKYFTCIGLAGVFGNYVNRIFYGRVVDFIYYGWCIGNVADICIMIGFVGLAYRVWEDRNNKTFRLLYGNIFENIKKYIN